MRAGEIGIVAIEEICDFSLKKAGKVILGLDTRNLWDRAGHCKCGDVGVGVGAAVIVSISTSMISEEGCGHGDAWLLSQRDAC